MEQLLPPTSNNFAVKNSFECKRILNYTGSYLFTPPFVCNNYTCTRMCVCIFIVVIEGYVYFRLYIFSLRCFRLKQ